MVYVTLTHFLVLHAHATYVPRAVRFLLLMLPPLKLHLLFTQLLELYTMRSLVRAFVGWLDRWFVCCWIVSSLFVGSFIGSLDRSFIRRVRIKRKENNVFDPCEECD